MQIAGKVVPLGKGEYDADATYNHLDWVRFEGSTWCCKKDNVKGIEPVEGDTWIMISEKGQTGASVNVVHDPKQGRTTSVHFINADTGEVLDTIDVLDGEDGAGNGDMKAKDYATKESAKGIVDRAIELNDGTKKISIEDIEKKIEEPTAEGTNGQALMTDGNGNRFWGTVASEQLITSVADEFEVGTAGEDKGKLSLSSTVTDKLDSIDENVADGFLKGNLWNEKWEVGKLNTDGTPLSGTDRIRSAEFTKINPSTTYYVCASIGNLHFFFYDSNKVMTGSALWKVNGTFSTPSGAMYLKFESNDTYGTSYRNDIAIIEGTSGSYVPYAKSNVKLTEDVDYAYENGYASRNLYDISKATTQHFSVLDGTLTNTNVDTREIFYALIQVMNGTSFVKSESRIISSVGRYSFTIDTRDVTLNALRISHAGITRDVRATIPFDKKGIFTLSFDVVGFNPSVIGGLSITNIQMNEGEEALPYTPYAKSNVELTNNVNDIDASLKMLGYTLPSELQGMNYIDGSGVFHQRIGRVDLGNYKFNKGTIITVQNVPISKSVNNSYIQGYSLKSYSQMLNTPKSYTQNDGNGEVYINDSSLDATTIKGLYFYYELATEITAKVDGNERVANIGNPNFINNSFFANNSKGGTIYSSSGPTIDEWYLQVNQDTTLEKLADGVKLSTNSTTQWAYEFYQTLKLDGKGKTYTVSVKVGTVVGSVRLWVTKNSSSTTIVNKAITSAESNSIVSVTFTTSDNIYRVGFYKESSAANSIEILGIKLEEGGISTLDSDNPYTEGYNVKRLAENIGSNHIILDGGNNFNARDLGLDNHSTITNVCVAILNHNKLTTRNISKLSYWINDNSDIGYTLRQSLKIDFGYLVFDVLSNTTIALKYEPYNNNYEGSSRWFNTYSTTNSAGLGTWKNIKYASYLAPAYKSLGEEASTLTYTLPDDGTYMFFVQTASSTSTSYNGFAMVNKNGSTVTVSKMSGLSSVSVTNSNGVITIKNSSTSTTYKYNAVVQKVI